MDIRHEMLEEFLEELSTTKVLLDRVPEDKLEWQPHPRSMALGQLAMHLATLPGNMANISQGDSFDLSARTRAVSVPKTSAEVLTAFEQSTRDVESMFTQTTEERISAFWRLMDGEREILARPRFKIWRSFLLNHWYHHRGQLTVYLRLLDIPIPSIYGPSADERPF